MTFKPVSIYTKKNSISNDLEYFCWYYSKGSLLRARITKTTFDNLKSIIELPTEQTNYPKGVQNESNKIFRDVVYSNNISN